MATTLRARSNAEKGAIRDALRREVWPLIEAGKIKPVVDSVFPLAEARSGSCPDARKQPYRQTPAETLTIEFQLLKPRARGG